MDFFERNQESISLPSLRFSECSLVSLENVCLVGGVNELL